MLIFIFSIFQCNLVVYASAADLAAHLPDWDELSEFDKWVMIIEMCGVSARALWKGDYEAILNNIKAVSDYAEGDPLESGAVTVSNDGIILSEDLMSAFKQALLEYAEETNGFRLYSTTNINTVSPTMFSTSYEYNSFINLVQESGCIAVRNERRKNNCFYVALPFHEFENPVSLVNSFPSSLIRTRAILYDTFSWQQLSYSYYEIKTRYVDDSGYVSYKTFNSYKEGKKGSILDIADFFLGWQIDVGNAPGEYQYILYSTDGRKLRVFNSLNALKNYTVGQRGVYFGSGFYDTPGEIKVSFDDLEKYMNKDYDKLFDELKDLINKESDGNEDSLTEEDLEKLVDKILNASGGDGGSGSGSGSSSGIIGWLEKIYDKLADMLKQLKSIKRWTVVDTVINGVDAVADWLDLIHDIISDADDGMESAVSTLSSALDDSAGLLKKKFPFSVPWDILAFVTLFAAEPEVPHFEIPIDIGVSAVGLDIHYDFVVDFSDYQYLSDVLRAVLSLTYAVGLIKMTAGVASTKKEE